MPSDLPSSSTRVRNRFLDTASYFKCLFSVLLCLRGGRVAGGRWQVQPKNVRVCVCVCRCRFNTPRLNLNPWEMGNKYPPPPICTPTPSSGVVILSMFLFAFPGDPSAIELQVPTAITHSLTRILLTYLPSLLCAS